MGSWNSIKGSSTKIKEKFAPKKGIDESTDNARDEAFYESNIGDVYGSIDSLEAFLLKYTHWIFDSIASKSGEYSEYVTFIFNNRAQLNEFLKRIGIKQNTFCCDAKSFIRGMRMRRDRKAFQEESDEVEEETEVVMDLAHKVSEVKERIKELNDKGYALSVYFDSESELKDFCKRFDLDIRRIYFDGLEFVKRYGIEIKAPNVENLKPSVFKMEGVEILN